MFFYTKITKLWTSQTKQNPDTPAEIQFANLSRDTVRTPRITSFNSSFETSNTFVPTNSYENCPIKLLETSKTRDNTPISDTSSGTQPTAIPQTKRKASKNKPNFGKNPKRTKLNTFVPLEVIFEEDEDLSILEQSFDQKIVTPLPPKQLTLKISLPHIHTHKREKSFQCEICLKHCRDTNDLARHLRTHTGEKPFGCGICHTRFSQNITLQNHLRRHTGEKPYECGICHTRFRHSGNLASHERAHTGEKHYQCRICKKAFTRSYQRNKHQKIHL